MPSASSASDNSLSALSSIRVTASATRLWSRRLGGYAKDPTPFSEFIWADFLRRRIDKDAVAKNFDKAMKEALTLAKGKETDYLPGWCGPTSD